MTLSTDEFIRRFLLHVLPQGFRRVRYYRLIASAGREANVARARELLVAPAPAEVTETAPPPDPRPPCPCCGGRMVIIEIFQRVAASGTRSAIVASLYLIRRDEPQPAVEAAVFGHWLLVRLRHSPVPRPR